MELIFKRSNDAKVATAAPQPPKQVGMLGFADVAEIAICRDQIGGDQVVGGQAISTRQMTPSAAEREPGNAGSRYLSSRCGQTEGLGFAIEFTPRRTGFCTCRALRLMTSATPRQRAINAGRLSIMPFQTRRASS
jgi:hypothetical protein